MEFAKLESLVGPGWAEFLKPFMCVGSDGKCKYDDVSRQLKEAYGNTSQKVFPAMNQVFRCFKETPLEKVRVIVLGQDPYPNEYANGIAFSCDKTPLPKSLLQVYNAIEKDEYKGMDLTKDTRTGVLCRPGHPTWMEQGVLMLNAALTVVEKQPASHLVIWKPFVEFIVSNIWRVKRNLIFIAWGAHAKDLLTYNGNASDSFGEDGLGYSSGVNIFHAFVLTAEHPAAAAKRQEEWVTDNFSRCNLIIKLNNFGESIVW